MSSAVVIPELLLAGLLLAGGILAAGPLSTVLARAAWPLRAPGPALVLWQALCLAAGLSVVGSFVVIAIHPWGGNIFAALAAGRRQLWAGDFLLGLAPVNIGALVVAATIGLYLLLVMVLTTAQTLQRRQRHRRTLDLISNRRSGFDVLDSSRPVAYSLPGIKPRVVLSAGLLATLGDDEARAAIEHERAHLRARHDLLLLPFGAWARALRWVPGVRQGRLAVAELAEMHADDVAARRVSPEVLAAALAAVAMAGVLTDDADAAAVDQLSATGSMPGGSESGESPHHSSIGAVAVRVRRLLDPAPLESIRRGAVYLLAFAVLAIPTTALVVGWR